MEKQYSAFEEDFFLYHENFERVSSGSFQNARFFASFDPKVCPLCQTKFNFFSIKHKCHSCGLSYCGECVRKIHYKDYCQACYALENNMVNFNDLKQLQEYRNNNSSPRFKEATGLQTGVLFFTDFLKDNDNDNHEYGILPLYKLERFYIANPIAQTVQQILYNHILKCRICKKLNVLIDLFCDISVVYPENLKKCNFENNLLMNFIDPLDLQLTASTARLILLLVENLSYDPENPKYIDIIASDSKPATAFMTAALCHKYPIPTIFEESQRKELRYNTQNLPKIVENVLSLFDSFLNTSLAAQYFGSIILLSISESDSGCSELAKHLPLHNIIQILILCCPSQLGLSKNEGKIAVYLSRMVKNLWFFCERSKESEDLLPAFFPSVLGFILDVTEKQCGYDKFSHLCIVQSIALEIAESVDKHAKLRDALISPHFQEIFRKMKSERQDKSDGMSNERILIFENEITQLKQTNQQQLEKIQELERENQIIRSKMLDTQAIVAAKDAEIIKLKRQIESPQNSQNKVSENTQKVRIENGDEIEKLNSELIEKDRIIGENKKELTNAVSKIQKLTEKWNDLTDMMLSQDNKDTNLDEIVKLPAGF